MKKRAIIFLVLLLVGFVGYFCLRYRFQPPTAATTFLGFTNANSAGAPLALFALSNPPPAGLNLHSVQLPSTINEIAAGNAGHFNWAKRESWGMLYAISVATTNEPLQVVFRFQQRAVGLRRIPEQLQELFGRITGNEREFFTGSVFFVTNKTGLR